MLRPLEQDGDAMQAWPMTVDRFIEHAARWHGRREIVSRRPDGTIARTDWAALAGEARRLAAGLMAKGVKPGDRVATLAMNGSEHLAAWFGIIACGAVCHTLNPRLADEQLAWIVRHAADRIILADDAFVGRAERLRPVCPDLREVVPLGGPSYAALLRDESEFAVWPTLDERDVVGLCYTSGTTGDPKGVRYTHRSNYLHTLMVLQPDVFGLSATDTILPVVPMFHANAWGLTFAAAAAGTKLVLPGAHLDGASVYELLQGERVTFTAGVPTVWQNLLAFIDANSLRLDFLERVMIGGAACPDSLFEAFDRLGVRVQHNWGMTETSPLGTTGTATGELLRLDGDGRRHYLRKQGRVPIGVDVRIVDDDGRPLPHDGAATGALEVRGHSVVERYEGADHPATRDGWFDTGDVATIDELGYVRITDRAKDVIKSGGEWISSVDMENAVMTHPEVELAAVIAVPHPRWDERPLLLVQTRPGSSVTTENLRHLLSSSYARWQLPDEIHFVDAIPIGATGKIDKRALRNSFASRTIASDGDGR